MEDKIIYMSNFLSLNSYWRNINSYRNLLYKYDYAFKELEGDDYYKFYDIHKRNRPEIETYKFFK